MGFDIEKKTAIFKVTPFEPGSHVYFQDIHGSSAPKVQNPLVGSWFRIEEGPEATPPPYDYDETGVVIEGTINLKDEKGRQVSVVAGDTFFIHRGSTISFSSPTYGIAYKSGAREKARL